MSVIEECRARFGAVPCIRIIALDGTLREAHDCVGWCPLLKRAIEDEDGEQERFHGGHS